MNTLYRIKDLIRPINGQSNWDPGGNQDITKRGVTIPLQIYRLLSRLYSYGPVTISWVPV